MKIGVPKEIKNQEYRVGLVPSSVQELTATGHQVYVETGAGLGVGVSDRDYQDVGATIVATAADAWQQDLVVKVKEPQDSEYKFLNAKQMLFTYLHLAADKPQAEALMASGVTAIAYETVTNDRGQLPLLTPMSEVAGRLAVQAGAHCLEKRQGGSGVLLGGVPGVSAGKVVIIGGGHVGTNALRMALGMGAQVFVLDRSLDRLRELDAEYGNQINTVYATQQSIHHYCRQADLVIGAVLVPGATAPKLLKEKTIKEMRPGSVVVDVAIDQGGCFETSHATTHDNPTYVVHGIVHYCVANMPGAVARTSAFALNNATIPFVLALANKGTQAMVDNKHLRHGLNVMGGKITYKAVADDLSLPYRSAEDCLGM